MTTRHFSHSQWNQPVPKRDARARRGTLRAVWGINLESSLEKLLDRQARRWQIEGGAGMPQPRGPLVAVSRWAGAYGDEVASRVAAWLDYGLFGPASIDRLAAEPELAAHLILGLDAAQLAAVDARVAAVMASAPAAPAGLVRAVATLGERGMAVVLGRGAASILPSTRALRVLVVAPEAARAERTAQAQQIPLAEAIACVASADSARRAALHERFGIAAEDLTHYDLVLNTEALSIEAAAALAVDALRRRFPLQ
jgi:hypothetical protein